MNGFGDVVFPSSRACADDEEEDGDNIIGAEVEWTEEGEAFLQGKEEKSYVLAAFNGKIGLGLGQGFIKDGKKFTLLGQISLRGDDRTSVDLCSFRPRRNSFVKIFVDEESTVVLVLINSYGVPRYLANDIVAQIQPLIESSSSVVIFHSEVAAYFRAYEYDRNDCIGRLYYLPSSTFPESTVSGNLKQAEQLPPPNIIGGTSAGILTECEVTDKPGLMLITYAESDVVDSISLAPFLRAITRKPLKQKEPSEGVELSNIFSRFEHTVRSSTDVSNLYS